MAHPHTPIAVEVEAWTEFSNLMEEAIYGFNVIPLHWRLKTISYAIIPQESLLRNCAIIFETEMPS